MGQPQTIPLSHDVAATSCSIDRFLSLRRRPLALVGELAGHASFHVFASRGKPDAESMPNSAPFRDAQRDCMRRHARQARRMAGGLALSGLV